MALACQMAWIQTLAAALSKMPRASSPTLCNHNAPQISQIERIKYCSNNNNNNNGDDIGDPKPPQEIQYLWKQKLLLPFF